MKGTLRRFRGATRDDRGVRSATAQRRRGGDEIPRCPVTDFLGDIAEADQDTQFDYVAMVGIPPPSSTSASVQMAGRPRRGVDG
jgi:hypothetical protein